MQVLSIKNQLFLVFILCIYSCQNNETKSNSKQTGKENAINNAAADTPLLITSVGKLKFKLKPQLHREFHYKINTTSTTVIQAPTKEVESFNEMKVSLTYESVKDSAGYITLKLTYDKIHIVIKKGDEEKIVIDADTPPEEQTQVEQILSALKNSTLFVTINPKGEVSNTKGTQEITDKVMKSVVGNDLQMQQLVQQLINKLAGDDFVEENLKNAFFVLPETELAEGDKWTRSTSQNSDFSFDVNSNYILESFNNHTAEIISEGVIKSKSGNASNLLGQQVNANFEGKQTASLKIDVTNGMLRYGKSKTKISGSVTVQGHEVPVDIKMSKEIVLNN